MFNSCLTLWGFILVMNRCWSEMEIKIFYSLYLMAIEFFSFHWFSLAGKFEPHFSLYLLMN